MHRTEDCADHLALRPHRAGASGGFEEYREEERICSAQELHPRRGDER
jgi:hypothetical protein